MSRVLIIKILELGKNFNLSKHEQLVRGVVQTIEKGELAIGDQLPSINSMVQEIGFARKTIVKAYGELKDRGLIESKKLKGYFIISVETNTTLRIALLLFAFQSFQEDFYNAFRHELGKSFHIDVFFHHNNMAVFESILVNIQGKYGKYVIAPIQNDRIAVLLRNIPSEKLLIVDRYLPLGRDYSFVSQEFEEATFKKLVELSNPIKEYGQFILYINAETDYAPIGLLRAFSKFLAMYHLRGGIEKGYKPHSIAKGNVYFIINDAILWLVLRDCLNQGLRIGKDIGILSHDDSVAKEIAFGGITTISSDFKEMGKLAAEAVKSGKKTKVIMPFNLNRRNSL